jgi:hypothetical protein
MNTKVWIVLSLIVCSFSSYSSEAEEDSAQPRMTAKQTIEHTNELVRQKQLEMEKKREEFMKKYRKKSE